MVVHDFGRSGRHAFLNHVKGVVFQKEPAFALLAPTVVFSSELGDCLEIHSWISSSSVAKFDPYPARATALINGAIQGLNLMAGSSYSRLMYYSFSRGKAVLHRAMRFSGNPSVGRCGWRCLLVAIAIVSLTATLVTRFSMHPDSQARAIKSVSSPSGDPKRSDQDAARFIAPVIIRTGLKPTIVHSHVMPDASASPLSEILPLSLSNRPPPHSFGFLL